MTVWEYAQLKVAYDNRLVPLGGKWTIDWHGPDAPRRDVVGEYGDVVAELARAGRRGWELVDVATLAGEDNRRASEKNDWSLTRYTFKRSYDSAATSAEPAQQDAAARSPAAITSQRGHRRAEPVTGEAILVRVTAYWLADGTAEGHDLGLAAGQVLISREAVQPRSPAEVGLIALFRAEYEDPGISAARRERLKVAAADYAASVVENQLDVTWWATPQSYSLSEAADLLNGSADWLRALVERPLADAGSLAGAADPFVLIGAGVTAEYVTAPLTRPLADAARACAITGIVVGLTTGTPPLVMACAKPFVHDEARRILSWAFEQVISSITARQDGHGDTGPDTRSQSPEPPQPGGSPVQKDPAEREQPLPPPRRSFTPRGPARMSDNPPPRSHSGSAGVQPHEPPGSGIPGRPGPQRPEPPGPVIPGP